MTGILDEEGDNGCKLDQFYRTYSRRENGAIYAIEFSLGFSLERRRGLSPPSSPRQSRGDGDFWYSGGKGGSEKEFNYIGEGPEQKFQKGMFCKG